MRLLKKKTLWFTLYGIVISALFLYLLFPSEQVRRKIEDASRMTGWTLKTASVNPSLPFGLAFNDVLLFAPEPQGEPFFRGERLDLQAAWWTFLSKRKSVRFSGRAYGGAFDGRIGVASFSQKQPPREGRLNFSNMDLSKIRLPGIALTNGVAGLVRGSVAYAFVQPADPFPEGVVSVHLDRGVYPLPEPFLGINQIEIDTGEIQGQLKNGSLQLDKIELFGKQINCFLSGDIRLSDDLTNSALNLKGTLEIVGQSKLKMNVTVGGTLARPSFRYI
ncbi:MAG: type II secretion system protein GspN [Smithellaceae bacterium]